MPNQEKENTTVGSRPIRFRAWDKKENGWYSPKHEAYRGSLHELLVSFKGDLVAHTMTGVEHESLWPNQFTLMQYTNLKDKNGKEIYEGDVVMKDGEDKFFYEIVWKDWYWAFKHKTGTFRPSKTDWHAAITIGNIYENPDLLK